MSCCEHDLNMRVKNLWFITGKCLAGTDFYRGLIFTMTGTAKELGAYGDCNDVGVLCWDTQLNSVLNSSEFIGGLTPVIHQSFELGCWNPLTKTTVVYFCTNIHNGKHRPENTWDVWQLYSRLCTLVMKNVIKIIRFSQSHFSDLLERIIKFFC